MANCRWQIKTFAVDTASWTDIIIPSTMLYGCSQVIIRYDGDTLLIGDKDDVNGQDILRASVQEIIGSGIFKKYIIGDVVCSIKAQSISGNAKVRFNL